MEYPRAAKRKGQTEEQWQLQVEQFQSAGPITQTDDFFDEMSPSAGSSKIDLNRIKYAAEREYYLGNYEKCMDLINANIGNFHGRLAQELQVILKAVMARR